MRQLLILYEKCKKSDSYFILVLLRFILHKIFHKKTLLLHQNVKLKGVKNIDARERIEVGIEYNGFIHKTDKTFLHINGKLIIKGKYSIAAKRHIGQNPCLKCSQTLSLTEANVPTILDSPDHSNKKCINAPNKNTNTIPDNSHFKAYFFIIVSMS